MRGNAKSSTLEHIDTMTVKESIQIRTRKEQKQKQYDHNSSHRIQILSIETYSGKRLLDILFAGIGAFALLLVYPFIALAIKLSSKGPVIFKQQRTGLEGDPFICYKFRTMDMVGKRDVDGKPDITKKGDARLFWVGNFLRKLNIDELPQVFNVLKGDMSLVGPRPYHLKECAYWNSTFDDFYYRYAVKPGISGLAQAKGYRGGTHDKEHMRKRLDYDLIYVEKNSFRLDMKIIGRTILQMVHLDTKAH